ncbi:MAG TPA: transglycosylase domain-containing protein, partial [Pyrinomonadaceae bacterium]
MAIEITGVPDAHGLEWLARVARRLIGFSVIITAVAAVLTADALFRSYKYYSQIIDARLASGYVTSRPGLYAAPRVLQPGQKLSRDKLIKALRRAGYLETSASNVWSGSFIASDNAIEIRPARSSRKQPAVVRVGFADDEIVELTADGITVESFTLEPEVLSNDLSSKAGKREALSYDEIPPLLVQAILAIEDRRFFDHSGVDFSGLARALLRNAGDERMGQGGSTITQQLVKNTYLSPEKTL